MVSYTHSFSGSITWCPVSTCSSASSSVLNVKTHAGSKQEYVLVRSLSQALESALHFFCLALVTSWLHSPTLSNPVTSCLHSKLFIFMPSPTLYACQTRIPSLSKEKLLYLVTPGILLLPTAADILDVSILQTATRVPTITGGTATRVPTITSAVSMSLFSAT